jgi:hypothetical protein
MMLAMSAWGDTDLDDGSGGEQPRDIDVIGNFGRELGFWEKQSSFWFQAKACSVTLRHNIFFNAPRAAINFNDFFGGDNVVESNLLFNTCRESGGMNGKRQFHSIDELFLLCRSRSNQ